MPHDRDHLRELITVRDWLRYAVSRFNAAGIAYGHGTDRALDEAAFLILATLSLEVDDLDPWLEARLTSAERAKLADVIEARIETRKPAPYLVGSAYIRGRRFIVDERAIVPRSFIAELLSDRIDHDDESFPPFPPDAPVARVLDLCTGGGSLAILAALTFPQARIDAVDISAPALALARSNIDLYRLGDRIALHEGDLYAPLAATPYDVILSNPPYVTDAVVAAFPAEHQAEPVLAHRGGPDGLDLVQRILDEAASFLGPNGQIVIEIGAAREALLARYPHLPFVWLDTAASSGEVIALPAAALVGGNQGKPTPKRPRAPASKR